MFKFKKSAKVLDSLEVEFVRVRASLRKRVTLLLALAGAVIVAGIDKFSDVIIHMVAEMLSILPMFQGVVPADMTARIGMGLLIARLCVSAWVACRGKKMIVAAQESKPDESKPDEGGAP